MRWLKMSGTGLAVSAVGLAVSCGGGGTAQPPRDATADDLPKMVLQQEDLPAGFRQTDKDGRIDSSGEVGIQTYLTAFLLTSEDDGIPSRFSEFELPPEEAGPGGTICITSFALVTENSEDSELGLFNFAELIGTSVDEPVIRDGDAEIELLSSTDLRGVAWRIRSPSEDLCEAYQDEPAEGYVFYFIDRNASGVLFAWTSGSEADFQEAVTLARQQAGRIEAVLAGKSE